MNIKHCYCLLGMIAFLAIGIACEAQQSLNGNPEKQTPTPLNNPTSPEDPSLVSASPAPNGVVAPVKEDVRIAVISDLNSGYASTDYNPGVNKAIKLIPDWQPDLVLSAGDSVAGQHPTKVKVNDIIPMWEGFKRYIADPLSRARLPFGFTLGNHDSQEPQLASEYLRNYQPNLRLEFVDQNNFPFYYSFQQKGIFYLVLKAWQTTLPKEQLDWVEKSLASPAAQNAEMRIVIGHLSLYGVIQDPKKRKEVLSQTSADQLQGLLRQYNVHTYISGHQHAYYPGKRKKLELLFAGTLGSNKRKLLGSQQEEGISTLTIVDVNLTEEKTNYTTYDIKTMNVVNIQVLPKRIDGVNGCVLRRDIEENNPVAQGC